MVRSCNQLTPHAFAAPLPETNGTFRTADGQPTATCWSPRPVASQLTPKRILVDDPPATHPTAGSSVTRDPADSRGFGCKLKPTPAKAYEATFEASA